MIVSFLRSLQGDALLVSCSVSFPTAETRSSHPLAKKKTQVKCRY